MSRPARGVWIEMPDISKYLSYLQSRPARGVWMEINVLKNP